MKKILFSAAAGLCFVLSMSLINSARAQIDGNLDGVGGIILPKNNGGSGSGGVTAPVCGNGILEEGEQCDDGNSNSGDGCDTSCQTELPPTAPQSTPTGGSGGGGGGGGALQSLTIFNETIVSVSLPHAAVTWFTNVAAACTAWYDSASHETPALPPSYGYGSQAPASTSNGTFHTSLLTGLVSGTNYYWRPVCSNTSGSAVGQQTAIAALESPRILGTQFPDAERVKVLGFEKSPQSISRAVKKGVELPCMQTAVVKRDTAITAALTNFYGGAKTALETRQGTLVSAWKLTDRRARRSALRAAWNGYKTSIRDLKKTIRSNKRAAWVQFNTDRKACRGNNGDDNETSSADESL